MTDVSNIAIKRAAAIALVREKYETKRAGLLAELRAELAAIEREYERDMAANLEQLLEPRKAA